MVDGEQVVPSGGERNGGELTVDLDEDTRRSVVAAAPQLAGVCVDPDEPTVAMVPERAFAKGAATSKATSKVLVMKRSTGSDTHAR